MAIGRPDLVYRAGINDAEFDRGLKRMESRSASSFGRFGRLIDAKTANVRKLTGALSSAFGIYTAMVPIIGAIGGGLALALRHQRQMTEQVEREASARRSIARISEDAATSLERDRSGTLARSIAKTRDFFQTQRETVLGNLSEEAQGVLAKDRRVEGEIRTLRSAIEAADASPVGSVAPQERARLYRLESERNARRATPAGRTVTAAEREIAELDAQERREIVRIRREEQRRQREELAKQRARLLRLGGDNAGAVAIEQVVKLSGQLREIGQNRAADPGLTRRRAIGAVFEAIRTIGAAREEQDAAGSSTQAPDRPSAASARLRGRDLTAQLRRLRGDERGAQEFEIETQRRRRIGELLREEGLRPGEVRQQVRMINSIAHEQRRRLGSSAEEDGGIGSARSTFGPSSTGAGRSGLAVAIGSASSRGPVVRATEQVKESVDRQTSAMESLINRVIDVVGRVGFG